MTSNERISDHSTVLGLLRRIDKGYLLTDIEKQEFLSRFNNELEGKLTN